MERKNSQVFMQCSVSNQSSERTARASNCSSNTPLSEETISLKPAFQAILRDFLLSHKTSDILFWNYMNKLWRQVQKGSQKNPNSWVFRQNSSTRSGQLSVPSSEVRPRVEGRNRQGKSASLLRLKIPKTIVHVTVFSITILCASELFLSMSMGGRSKIDDLK